MKNKRKRTYGQKGFTLIEAVLSILIFLIMALGVLAYRYSANLNPLKAKQHLTATDLAAAFVETWQGFNGVETFDPETLFASDLSISSGTGPAPPSGYTLLGNYDITDDDQNYQLILSWKDAGSSLRELNVIVEWTYHEENNTSTYQLTTYVDRS